MSKRVLLIGDLHSGHLCGLTPPAYQIKKRKAGTTKRNKWADLQAQLWGHYVELLDKYAPFDNCLVLGDMIDGKGYRSGGSELITADLEEQCDMAVDALNQVRLHARKGYKVVGVYGTGYHVGEDTDWENIISDRAGMDKIGAHEWVSINNCIFDIKHHIGSSTIPHGRYTALAKDKLWNQLWTERGMTVNADVLVRAHVHYHAFCGGPGWLAITLPALQGMGTKYGRRRCSGVVDWGITVFDVDDNGSFDWHCDTVRIEAHKAKVVKL